MSFGVQIIGMIRLRGTVNGCEDCDGGGLFEERQVTGGGDFVTEILSNLQFIAGGGEWLGKREEAMLEKEDLLVCGNIKIPSTSKGKK